MVFILSFGSIFMDLHTADMFGMTLFHLRTAPLQNSKEQQTSYSEDLQRFICSFKTLATLKLKYLVGY
jgi:hypothetical protein